MAGEGVRVEGARAFRKALKDAGDDLTQVKEAHADAAAIVAHAAIAIAPRVTGKLAGGVRSSGSASAATIRAGGARLPYAAPIHWGWPRRGIKAQPFISTAAQSTESRWYDVYLTHVQRIMDSIGERI